MLNEAFASWLQNGRLPSQHQRRANDLSVFELGDTIGQHLGTIVVDKMGRSFFIASSSDARTLSPRVWQDAEIMQALQWAERNRRYYDKAASFYRERIGIYIVAGFLLLFVTCWSLRG